MYTFFDSKDRLAILISVLILSFTGTYATHELFNINTWYLLLFTFLGIFIFQYISILLPSLIRNGCMAVDSRKKLKWIISEAQKEYNDLEKP